MIRQRLKAFGAFWYDFVIGDDWRVAVAVVIALSVTYVLAHNGHRGVWWVVLIGPVVLLPLSLWRATALSRSAGSRPDG